MIRPILLTGLLLVALSTVAAPVAAAECSLTVTANPGRSIDVTGTAFPADADVTLVVVRNGAQTDTQAVHSDATGEFTASVDAGPGRGGAYTLVATSGTCKAVADIVAVETAGGLGGIGGPTAPPTDTLAPPATARRDGNTPAVVALVGLAICGVAATGARLRLRASRRSRR